MLDTPVTPPNLKQVLHIIVPSPNSTCFLVNDQTKAIPSMC